MNEQNERKTKVRKKRSPALDVWVRFRRNPLALLGLFILFCLITLALSADVIAPAQGRAPGYDVQDLRNRFQPPGGDYLMGTDNLGRCVFSRIAHGARTTLTAGILVVTISMSVGIFLGSISGFYGGIVDNIFMRFVDVMLAVPTMLLAIAIVAVMPAGLTTLLTAVVIGQIPSYARVVRGAILSVKGQEYIEAARAIGASDFRIIRKHILPNCMAPIIVESTMGIGSAITFVAALSFLGLGISPPSPEWGAMLSDGRRFMLSGEWWLVFFPGVSIALVIFALNMMGDGLRDALDPRLKR